MTPPSALLALFIRFPRTIEKLDGKIGIIQKRGFQDNVDVCMMLHPSPKNVHFWAGTAFQDVRVEFRGKSSHAGGKSAFT